VDEEIADPYEEGWSTALSEDKGHTFEYRRTGDVVYINQVVRIDKGEMKEAIELFKELQKAWENSDDT
jgi:hypothetical protein